MTTLIRIKDFKISLWSTQSLELVADVDFLSLLPPGFLDLTNVHTEISDIKLNNSTLAVQVFVTSLDWLLPEEMVDDPQAMNLTLIWYLDTKNPRADRLHFRQCLRRSNLEIGI